jgi:HD-GYP domain-containing protein (c-di-GMP phosphodiesterase class II)
MEQQADIFVIAANDEIRKICETLKSDFGYPFREWKDIDTLFEGERPAKEPRIVILSAISVANKNDIAGQVQVVRQLFNECFIICIVAKTLDPEVASFLKKSGADIVVLEDEAVRSSKIHFVCSQTLSSAFAPIKASELTPGVEITFDLYHLLPMRGKFLVSKHKGDVLDEAKISKCASVGEMYIRQKDAEAFNQYTNAHADRSAAGLARRCRAQFLSLTSSYINLIYHLTNRGEYASFKQGQDFLKQTIDVAQSMVASLGGFDDAWNIINNSSIGTFGSVERAPAIAAYAALFSLQTDTGPLEDVMLSALLSDLGIIYLDPKITRKLRNGEIESLTPSEREEYQTHPSISIDVVLERKLPISQDVRNIIACSHERVDGSGFPRKLSGLKIPKISELIQIAEIFDQSTCVRMGRARTDKAEFRKTFFEKALNERKFSIDLIAKLSKQLS